MSDHSVSRGLPLHLLADKAVYETLRTMAESDHGSTWESIGEHANKRMLRLLRALAVERLVSRCGTWDLPPTPNTTFMLTARGYQLMAQLERLKQWAECRALEQGQRAPKLPRWAP